MTTYVIPTGVGGLNTGTSAAAANVTVIQNALNTYDDVTIPAGDWYVNSALTMTRSNDKGQTLRGVGRKASRLLATTAFSGDTAGYMLKIGNGTREYGHSLRDIGFSCQSGVRKPAAVHVDQIMNGTIEEVYFDRVGAMVLTEVVCFYVERFYAYDHNHMDGAFPTIKIDGGNDLFISSGILKADGHTGILITDTGATWIRDTDVIRFMNGMVLDAQLSDDQFDWCFFESCAFDSGQDHEDYPGHKSGVETHGVLIKNTGASYLHGMSFDNCWFASNSYGARILSVDNRAVDGIIFDNCKFVANKLDGIRVEAATTITTGPNTGKQTIENIDIRNCQIAGNGSVSNNTRSGVFIGSGVSGAHITNNTIGRWGSQPTTQKYGIELSGTPTRVQILGNDVSGNITKGIELGSAAQGERFVRDNMGYRTEHAGVVTFNTSLSGASTHTQAHYLDDVPAGWGGYTVEITPITRLDSVGASRFNVDTFGATSFTVRLDATVPQGATFAYSWRAVKC